MSRVKRGVTNHAKHKKVMQRAKGYRGRAKNCFRVAVVKTDHALQYAYRDRRTKKRNFRSLWIQRINAGAREHGLTYSQFMNGVTLAGIDLDRKALSEIAATEPAAFKKIVEQAKSELDKKPADTKKAA